MTRYISLGEYFWLAEQVTGIEAETLSHGARIELADSALHASQARFGGHEFQTCSTRRRFWSAASPGTIGCRTATNEQHGRR